jgi:5-methylthioadenosine/S-adenosylhomocysteine deaminase
MKACDLLINAAWVVPVAPNNIALTNHSVAITGNQIVELGPTAQLQQAYQAQEVLDLDHHIVMPGLINAHGHAAMSLLRGAGEDKPLEVWLNQTIWPMEARLMNPDYVRLGTELSITEMLRSGTTTFSDMYFYPEVVAKVCVEQGIRAQLAFPLIEFANPWSTDVPNALHKGLELFHALRHEDLVNVALGPHAAYSLGAEDMERVGMYAAELDIMVQIHLHETAEEVRQAVAQTGQTWIQRLYELGLLGPNLQAVHMTQLSEEEIALIAETGTHVVHCPTSNLKLASGYCPVAKLQEAGICVAIGTDGAASNNRLDMFDETRMAALLAKHEQHNAAAGKAEDAVRMATLDGAKALGIDHLTGSIEAGKAADLISINIHSLGIMPMYNPFAALVHGHTGHAVDHVIVNGQTLVKNSQFTRMNVTDLVQRVHAWHTAQT